MSRRPAAHPLVDLFLAELPKTANLMSWHLFSLNPLVDRVSLYRLFRMSRLDFLRNCFGTLEVVQRVVLGQKSPCGSGLIWQSTMRRACGRAARV